jgi:dihydrofolate reductase
MSRRLRYQVAASLDGFIAGPNGEYDWIVMDPAVDFAALFREFDTAVMGRKTYDGMTAQGSDGAMPGLDVAIFSRTLPATTRPGVRIFNDDPREIVAALKAKPGRDIWLFGGGSLFRSLLDAGLVDTVEVAVVPVLLGAGVPLLPPGATTKLVLADQKTLPSGIVMLAYSVPGGVGPAPRIRYIKAATKRANTSSKARRLPTADKPGRSKEKRSANREHPRGPGRKAPRR